MKRQIFILFYILCSVTLFSPHLLAKVADSRDIRLIAKTQDKDARSVQPVRAYLEGTDVYVSFLDSPVKATVTITDPEGLLVEEVVAFSTQIIQVPISKEGGSYKIEIVYGDVCLYGQFECGE